MKKRIAILTDAYHFRSREDSVLRGSSFYVHNFIKSLALENDVDIYCDESENINFPNIKNVFYTKSTITQKDLENQNYDFVWNMHLLNFTEKNFITFDVKHAHSRVYRQKKVRSPLEVFLKKIFQPKRYFSPEKIAIYKQNFFVNEILFTNSKIAKEDYVNILGGNEQDIHILHPIINIPDNNEINKRKNEVFTFGLAAVSFDMKGGIIFLKALNKLKKEKIPFKANIIYPNYEKNLYVNFMIIVLGLKKFVNFLPYQESMTDFYNSIDCLVMPSKEETFGMTAAEAMAYKTATIVSNVSGAADIIENGENGYIFDIKQKAVDNLYKTMSIVLRNKNLDKICENAYNTAKTLTLEEHSKKLNYILDEILKNRGKQR